MVKLPSTSLSLARKEKASTRSLASTLKLAAGMASAALIIDAGSQLLFWRKNQTEVIPGPGGSPHWLAIPGLGKSSGQFIQQTLEGQVPGTIDYLQLSTRGISAKKVGHALAAYYRKVYGQGERQSVMVHSMGLPTFLMGVEWCLEHDIAVPPIATLLAFSSPLTPDHTFHEQFIRRVSRFPYPGGVLSKFGIEFYQRYYSSRFRLTVIGKAAREAFKKAYSECAPALWASQIRTLAHRDKYQAIVFKSIITPDTRIVHFGDPDDVIVNVPTARRDFADFVHECGADLTVVEMPNQGHANMLGVRHQLGPLDLDTIHM